MFSDGSITPLGLRTRACTSSVARAVICLSVVALCCCGGTIMADSPQPGDANFDYKVDMLDFAILAANWNVSSGATWEMGDFDGDGAVGSADFSILCDHWTRRRVTLTVNIEGQGSVQLDPNQETYDDHSEVVLTATGRQSPVTGVVLWPIGPWEDLAPPPQWPDIANGGFENWTGDIAIPDDSWIGGGLLEDGYPVEETADVYEGVSCARFLWTGLDSNWDANLLTKSEMFELIAGNQYKLKVAYKGLLHPLYGTNMNIFHAHVGYTDSGGNFNSWSEAVIAENTAGSWNLHEYTFTATGSYARIYLSSQWLTHCLVDAVGVELVSSPPQADNWTIGGKVDGNYPVPETTDVYEGGSCAKFLWTGHDSAWNADLLTKSDMFDLTVGEQYTFQLAFKGLNHPVYGFNTNLFLAQVGYTDDAGNFTSWSDASVTDDTVGQWKLLQATFTATAGHARVFLSNQWMTHCLIDSVSVVPAGGPTGPGASGGWQFDHWENDLGGTANPATLLMDDDKTVKAVFRNTAEIRTRMLRNEYQELSIGVTNVTGQDQVLQVELDPNGVFPPGKITMRASYWIEAAPPVSGPSVWLDDALPRLDQDRYLRLRPGQTRRLWLTVDTNNVMPGLYELELRVASTADGSFDRIPVSIEVLPLALERDPDLHVYTYSYLTRLSTTNYKQFAVDDLKAHYQNTFVVDSVRQPTVDGNGNIITQADFSSAFDEWLDLIPDAKKVLFFWCWDCGESRATFDNQVAWLSPAWENALQGWIDGWLTYLSNRGMGFDQFAMYPLDETYDNPYLGGTEYEALDAVIEQLHVIDPRIQTFANPVGFNSDDLAAHNALTPDIDIWAPQHYLYDIGDHSGWPHPCTEAEKQAMRSFYRDEQNNGKLVWAYQCDGPMKALDVNLYYRKFAWKCWANGITGLGIWSYNDIRPVTSDGSSWSDFDEVDFAMIYELRNAPNDIPRDPQEPLIPSRRWQAWRAGIQDYLLLQQVRKAHPEYESLLMQLAASVLASPAPQVYEQSRQDLLNMLLED